MPNSLMRIEAAIKHAFKPLLFKDEARPRVIRAGVGRGLIMHLNRMNDLQKELGLWEIEAQRAYRRYVRGGSIVFDIGAGSGDSTLLLARLAAPGSVVAFEPDAGLSRLLEQNMALNPQLANIEIVRAYVGTARRHSEAIAGDVLAAGRAAPDFVKIDVDGGELDVLHSMERTLRDAHPVVLVEVHSRELEQHCAEYLASQGYVIRIIRNAWWRTMYPEYRPLALNRWVLAVPGPRSRNDGEPAGKR